MNALFALHSAVRYLVLVSGVVVIAYCIWGLAARKAAGKPLRAMGAAYTGILDLQIVVGIILLATFSWYPALVGHISMMVVAAAAAHVGSIVNRRRSTPGFGIPLISVVVSLALIAGGILAIGRGPLASSAF